MFFKLKMVGDSIPCFYNNGSLLDITIVDGEGSSNISLVKLARGLYCFSKPLCEIKIEELFIDGFFNGKDVSLNGVSGKKYNFRIKLPTCGANFSDGTIFPKTNIFDKYIKKYITFSEDYNIISSSRVFTGNNTGDVKFIVRSVSTDTISHVYFSEVKYCFLPILYYIEDDNSIDLSM